MHLERYNKEDPLYEYRVESQNWANNLHGKIVRRKRGNIGVAISSINPGGWECYVTLVKFNSAKIETVYADQPIEDVPALDRKTYRPAELTPYQDSWAQAAPMGIPVGSTVNYNSQQTKRAFASVGKGMSAYRASYHALADDYSTAMSVGDKEKIATTANELKKLREDYWQGKKQV